MSERDNEPSLNSYGAAPGNSQAHVENNPPAKPKMNPLILAAGAALIGVAGMFVYKAKFSGQEQAAYPPAAAAPTEQASGDFSEQMQAGQPPAYLAQQQAGLPQGGFQDPAAAIPGQPAAQTPGLPAAPGQLAPVDPFAQAQPAPLSPVAPAAIPLTPVATAPAPVAVQPAPVVAAPPAPAPAVAQAQPQCQCECDAAKVAASTKPAVATKPVATAKPAVTAKPQSQVRFVSKPVDLDAVAAKQAAAKSAAAAKPKPEEAAEIYSVYAQDAGGKAWLMNEMTGKTVIVVVGDKLPDGRVVRKIDADSESVITNKGVIK